MPTIDIRAVENDDFDIWLPLWEGYQRFYNVDIPLSVSRQTWTRFLSADEPTNAAIATCGGKAFGIAHFIYHRTTWATCDDCYLQDLFVSHDARGTGLGRALIEYVYADAKRHNVPRVHWLTHKTNHTAMQLYDRVGDRSGFILYQHRSA